jgi:hypothetical protein
MLDSIMGDMRPVGSRVLSGRKDRGRGNRPIRHGALSAIDTASALAISLRGGVVREAHASWSAPRWCRVTVAVSWSAVNTLELVNGSGAQQARVAQWPELQHANASCRGACALKPDMRLSATECDRTQIARSGRKQEPVDCSALRALTHLHTCTHVGPSLPPRVIAASRLTIFSSSTITHECAFKSLMSILTPRT